MKYLLKIGKNGAIKSFYWGLKTQRRMILDCIGKLGCFEIPIVRLGCYKLVEIVEEGRRQEAEGRRNKSEGDSDPS